MIARLEAARCQHWANALTGILELHRQVTRRRYEEGYEAGARACGPMCERVGELKVTQLATEIFAAGQTMQAVLARLETLAKEEP